MPSFNIITVIAMFSFAAFTGASPMPAPSDELAVRDTPKPLAQVLLDLRASITPLAQTLSTAIDVTSTVAVDAQIKPTIDQIQAAIGAAITATNALAGLPKSQILTFNGKVYTVAEIARITADVLNAIFISFSAVIRAAGPTRVQLVRPQLANVASQLAALLSAVSARVGGFLILNILPLIGGIINIILYVNVAALLDVLGLNLDVFANVNVLANL